MKYFLKNTLKLTFSLFCLSVVILSSCQEEEDPVCLKLQLVAGNNQLAIPNETLPEKLKVKVIDENGNAVKNASVNWQIENGTGVVTTSSTTDELGFAEASWNVGNNLQGHVVASIDSKHLVCDMGNSVTFSLKKINLQIDSVKMLFSGCESCPDADSEIGNTYIGYLFITTEKDLDPDNLQLKIQATSSESNKTEISVPLTFNDSKNCLQFEYCSQETEAAFHELLLQLLFKNSDIGSNSISTTLEKPFFEISNFTTTLLGRSTCESDGYVKADSLIMTYTTNIDLENFNFQAMMDYKYEISPEWKPLNITLDKVGENKLYTGLCVPFGRANFIEYKCKILLGSKLTNGTFESNQLYAKTIDPPPTGTYFRLLDVENYLANENNCDEEYQYHFIQNNFFETDIEDFYAFDFQLEVVYKFERGESGHWNSTIKFEDFDFSRNLFISGACIKFGSNKFYDKKHLLKIFSIKNPEFVAFNSNSLSFRVYDPIIDNGRKTFNIDEGVLIVDPTGNKRTSIKLLSPFQCK